MKATVSTKTLDITVGDIVHYEVKDDDYFLTAIVSRKNYLARTYRGETRGIVANLDHLFIVTAVPPLFNPLFIDRVLTVAAYEGIPNTILINKVDLGTAEVNHALAVYESLGITVLRTGAKYGMGIDELTQFLDLTGLEVVALAGVSGVGKSTLLNRLVPEAERHTREVSERTGHGRQTTTQPEGFLYQRAGAAAPVLLIDLPGVQNFGVAHLEKSNIGDAFPEICKYRVECPFSDCAHRAEQSCAVKEAVAAGDIAQSRYDSYVHMVREIEQAQEY